MWRILAMLTVVATQQIPSITIAGDADAAHLLQLSASDIASIRSRGVLEREVTSPAVPELFYTFPIPQSVPLNAKARAELLAQGLSEREIGIGESVGAFAPEGNGFWFGKSVYNEEGESMVGGIGFVSKDGAYKMLDLPSLKLLSISALLVERDAIWAGMFYQGERARSGRRLLRYDRKAAASRTFAVPGIIHTIVRLDRRLFIGTNQGPYMLKDDTITRLVWK